MRRHVGFVTEAEFLSGPETKTKVELIDGVVIAAPSARYGHQEVLGRLYEALRAWARGRDVTVVLSPCDVRFAPNRILQPDVFVVLERLPLDAAMPLTRIPELCVEILSQDPAYDRVRKRPLYAQAGVKELWLVDPSGSIERRTGPGLDGIETHAGTLRTPLLEGFELDVRALFAD